MPLAPRDSRFSLFHLRAAVTRAASIARRIVGVPDYERYVAHVHECHPGVAPMSAREFEESRLRDRYSRPGQRCC
jgi:uncharacterized short protein YbdD (DUF466 family)